MWVLDIRAGRWRREEPAGRPAPSKRDHHSVALHGGKMYVFGERAWRAPSLARPRAPGRAAAAAADRRCCRPPLLRRPAGGRSGSDYFHSWPLNDLWELDLASMRWEELKPRGRPPIPRFEESFVQWGAPFAAAGVAPGLGRRRHGDGAATRARTPTLHTAVCPAPHAPHAGSRLLVFGGQAEHVCQLNDLWQLDLTTLEWIELSAPRFCTTKCRERFGGRRDGCEHVALELPQPPVSWS